MGGITGHIKHLYEDNHLFKDDIIDILKNILIYKCKIVEKLDGFNLQIRLDERGEVRMIRNKRDLREGGGSVKDISTRWSDKPLVRDIYMSAMKKVEEYIKDLTIDFFNYRDSEYEYRVTLNIECLSGKTNIIPYDCEDVFLHNVWIYKREIGESTVEWELDEIKSENCFSHSFPVANTIIVEGDWELLNKYIIKLDELFGNNSTLSSVLFDDFSNCIKKMYPDIFNDYNTIMFLFHRWILGNTRDFQISILNQHNHFKEIKDIEKNNLKNIKNITYSRVKDVIVYIENDIIKHCKGFICDDNKNGVISIVKNELQKHLLSICNNPQSHYLVQFTNLITGILAKNINHTEGVVFRYKNNIYKLTGVFGTVNSLMWSK